MFKNIHSTSTWRHKASRLVNKLALVKAIVGIGLTIVLRRGDNAHAALGRTLTIPSAVAENISGKIVL